MAIDTELKYARLEDLLLDPLNPRLGRNNTGREVKQSRGIGANEGLDPRRVGALIP